MSKIYTKEEAIALKKIAFKKLNNLLESYIAKSPPSNEKETDYTKKAALISKWIEQYVNYISFENNFKPTRNISYARGDVVFVNFGFGVGSEFGGNHYAVVLDKDNKHNASNVTVVPLSSRKDDKDVYERDVDLGNELYEKIHLKLKTNLKNLVENLSKNKLMLSLLSDEVGSSQKSLSEDNDIERLQQELKQQQKLLETEIDNAKKVQKELLSLKEGSVAKLEQIRTISKIRIYNPKRKSNSLYGIRFSKPSMQKINDRIKELYVFNE